MVTDFKTLIPNPVTVSFRLECLSDLTVVMDILGKMSAFGTVIDLRTHLNRGNLPIVEPFMEIAISEDALQKLVTVMYNHSSDLHVALDTMRRLPMEQNPMERDYGKGEFSKPRT